MAAPAAIGHSQSHPVPRNLAALWSAVPSSTAVKRTEDLTPHVASPENVTEIVIARAVHDGIFRGELSGNFRRSSILGGAGADAPGFYGCRREPAGVGSGASRMAVHVVHEAGTFASRSKSRI